MPELATDTPERTREDMLAEYAARHAIALVHNRIRMVMEGEDRDVLAVPYIADVRFDELSHDAVMEELFEALWPDEISDGDADNWRCSAESCYIAARILRAIVYHADQFRGEAKYLFELSEEHERKAAEGG